MGVPAQYEAQRRAELSSARFVSLVAELKAIHAIGGADRAKNIVETALLGGKMLETSSFVFQIAAGVFDSDAVAPEIFFLSADVASDFPRVVGRAIARTLSRRRRTVPETLVDYTPTPSSLGSFRGTTGAWPTSRRRWRVRGRSNTSGQMRCPPRRSFPSPLSSPPRRPLTGSSQ